MTYKINQAQFEQVILLSPQKRYDHFISKVADWAELWTLKDSTGFVMYSDSTGQECLPVWPHSDYASALAKGSWADCKPYKIELSYFLDKWIPGMIQDERKVAVFTTPNEKGIVLNPKTLSEDLSEEIQKYE